MKWAVYHSGHQQYKRNGVAIIVNKKISKSVLGYNIVNDRIITLKLQGHPFNTSIIQIYAPTTDAYDDVIEQVYTELQEVLDNIPKKDMLFLIGDWNAKVGNIEEKGVTGRFGLGEQNAAGERLIEFCIENQLFIANTMFFQHKRRLHTWTSPDGKNRNQIDSNMRKLDMI